MYSNVIFRHLVFVFSTGIILKILVWQYLICAVNTLMIGKPEKGKMIENMLLQMAQTGQIMSKLGENELIGLLEKVNEQMQRKTVVKVKCTIFKYIICRKYKQTFVSNHK